MIIHCPLACFSCDKIEQFERCHVDDHKGNREIGNMNLALQGLEEHSVLNEIISGKWDKYRPEVLFMPTPTTTSRSHDKDNNAWLVRFDSFLTDKESKALVELGNKLGWQPSHSYSLGNKEENLDFDLDVNNADGRPRRSSKSVFCDFITNCEKDSTFGKIMDRISNLTSLPIGNIESVEMMKYSKFGDSFGRHSDYKVHDIWKPAGPRAYSLQIFLTDVMEGGATGFPNLDWTTVAPKKGQALLWPNVYVEKGVAQGMGDKMIYETLPVVEGELVVAHVWLHAGDWKKERDADCA